MHLSDVDTWNRRQCASWLQLYEYDVKAGQSLEGLRGQVKDILQGEKAYLLNDAVFAPRENEIRAAVKQLMAATDNAVVLAADRGRRVYVIPVVLGDGMVEYQVSDGLPGERTRSGDFYILAEAMALFGQIRQSGWPRATRHKPVKGAVAPS